MKCLSSGAGVLLIVGLVGCGTTVPGGAVAVEIAAPIAPAAPAPDGAALLATWRAETIILPPEFAPGLPRGEEELRFAPGMFEVGATDFWSYVFVLRLEQPVHGEAAIARLLDVYYDGLVATVGGARGLDLPADPSSTRVSTLGDGRYEAQIDLIEPFATGDPLSVRLEVESVGTVIRVAASPQPEQHPIWDSLRAVVALL